jgi:hypothetical protein
MLTPGLLCAQSLLPSIGWTAGPTVQIWHFKTPIAQPSGGVGDVAEIAIPFRVRVARGNWRIDLSGAGAIGAVHFSTDDDGRAPMLGGPTDVKLRLSGPLVGDATQLTVGFNFPTGKSSLNNDQIITLQTLAAPAFQLPITTFGSGAGATLGVLHAFHGEGWALALGASGEKRAEYSAVALALSSGASETRLTPGLATHLTAGLDRTVGQGRLNLLLTGDLFGKDRLRIGATTDSTNDYTLGPQLAATGQFEFGASGWRESSIGVGARVRSAYSDVSGTQVTGSNATYLEGALSAVRGGATGAGLVLGIDGRWQSGMAFTDALVGAAASTAGVTLGFEHAGARSATRFTVHAMYGTFDTGKSATSGMSLSLGLSVSARRDAQ